MERGVLLCVDDEIVILDALKTLLRKNYKMQHLIEAAQSAEEGLEILDDLSTDGYVPLVIISDWLMPGMKGDEFLIEAHKRFPYVIKVMLSGQASSEAVEKTKAEANLYQFISKPWSSRELLTCIDSGLEEYRQSKKDKVYG
ncbi:MAG: response regulator [Desulfovibrio sp.]